MRKFILYSLLLLLLLGCAAPIVRFDSDIKGQIIKEIEKATEKIDIAMYCLSDKGVINALRDAKREHQVVVRIIIDPKYYYLIKDQFIKDKELITLGGRKSGGDMHHKFIIFDRRRIMIGSYNISDNAHKENYENALFISDRAVIDKYQKEFDRLFNLP